MSKPRLQAPNISLPKPGQFYNQRIQEEMVRALENHLAKMQPAQARQIVTGSRSGGDALTNLLTALANLGYITDSTTA